ncbi:S-methyl-5-thioribose-1-phosphate isomerase [Methylonatrum kenyense]|uniref:S-methyl-5-thioribose-1-phosphate isomerase n=1 Tax=Methylonatrum kenyense TaxID=455253 RepID=UPI0020C17BC5|nr:S-methyl-5-thioribose-1-phosphate isomerase [Methylonatrum kenyense]MCK8515964.1 S-methyl-5-thioribose-1-phosphate isomerase [Methylonatrum kenyense]
MPEFDQVRPLRWQGDRLELLDQRLLPEREHWICCRDHRAVAQAIHDMVVRGAPAIGVTAAYGVVLAAMEQPEPESLRTGLLQPALDLLAAARPTAVNLHWAVTRMRDCLEGGGNSVDRLLQEADLIHDEDLAANRRMGELGAALLEPGTRVLTHCNTGSLATSGFGTALGVIREAWRQQRISEIYAGETRPWLQGARLTAWELGRDGLPVTLVADGATALLMSSGLVDWVIVGADRIAANGDVANKVGTYSLALHARSHGARFMVVAPASTVDMTLADGGAIPIEHRDGDELLSIGGQRIAAAGARAWNPVFDVTPARLVDALVTERGVLDQPDAAAMDTLFGQVVAGRDEHGD